MDLIYSPINNISNENLIIQSEPDVQKNVNNDFYLKKKDKSIDKNNRFIIRRSFCSSFSIIFFIPPSFLMAPIFEIIKDKETELSVKIIYNLLGFIYSLIPFIIIAFKIVLLKDESNKKIIIKEINFLCCTKKEIIFDLENTHFYIQKTINHGKNVDHIFYTLLIINDFKNLVGIDLDKSNIKQTPAKYLYCFDTISLENYSRRRLIKHLNKFVGYTRHYKNPLFFNINQYLQKEQKINKNEFSSCMKFSDHFFSYYLLGKFDPIGFNICLFYSISYLNFLLFLLFLVYKSFIKEYIIKLLGFISFPIFNIIIYIIYKCYNFKYNNICRIDCIYSKNFDRIFIGLVKYNKTKYVNTLEYQMDNINRFILEKSINNSNDFELKILFKNNEMELIYILKNKTQEDLEGLIYLLNERLIINTNTNIDTNEN